MSLYSHFCTANQGSAGHWNAHENEEDPNDYRPGGYHPAERDEMFGGKHRAICKLGWGQFSTVWLAWDIQREAFSAMKICKSAPEYQRASQVCAIAAMLLVISYGVVSAHPEFPLRMKSRSPFMCTSAVCRLPLRVRYHKRCLQLVP